MGLNIEHPPICLRFSLQGRMQHRMFQNVSFIARMIAMLIGEHDLVFTLRK